MKTIKLLLCFFAFAVTFLARAQEDTLFWFAVPNISNGVGETPIELLLVGGNQSSTVTIDMPANASFVPISINLLSNSSQSVDLTPNLALIESTGNNTVNNTGLRIQSTDSISASYIINSSGNKELFVLKGSRSLGQNFYTPFQENLDISNTIADGKSSIEIVAVEDGTTVLVTPRTDVVGHLANSTFSVLLNAGQTFTVADVNQSASTSLSGSIIASNKDVAVTVCEDAISNGACISTIGDQLVSLDNTGKKFVVSKGSSPTDYLVLLATENATQISLTNGSTTSQLLNWGETLMLTTTDAINYIESDKPIYLMHVSGNGCETSASIVPSMVCSGDSTASFIRPNSDDLSVFLYTFTGFENQFTINGQSGVITSANFQTVPGTSGDFVAGLINLPVSTIPAGGHFIIENTSSFGMAVYSEESGSGSYYGYPSSYKTSTIANAGEDAEICANTDLDLNGQIGGGSFTGVWSTSGYGTFQNPTNTLVNTYIPNSLDSLVSPVRLVLTSTGECPVAKDTLLVTITPEPIINAGVDQNLCANNASTFLQGTSEGGTTTGLWTTTGDGSFSPSNTDLDAEYIPGSNDLSSGGVSVVLTSTGAATCQAVQDTVNLTYASSPEVVILPDTIEVCQNNSTINLSGTVSGFTSTGKWSTVGNGVFTPNNLSLNVTYSPTTSEIATGGIYVYLVSTNNGICNQERDSVFIEFTNQPTVNAGVDYVLCSNTPEITLSGTVTGATGVQWSGGSGVISNPTSLSTTYQPTASEINSGSVSFTLESVGNGNCNVVSDQIEVNFIPVPQANFTASQVCLGQETELLDVSLPVFGNITNWEWDFGNGTTSSNQNNLFAFNTPGLNSVQLVVTTDAGCNDTTVQNVQVFELPTAGFSQVVNCSNGQIIGSFTDISSSTDPINYWYYDFGGLGTIAAPNPVQVFPPNATYSILHVVETVNGCTDTIIKTLEVPQLPIAGFSYNSDNSPTVGAVFNFVDTSQYASNVEWNIQGNIISETNPSQTYFSNGVYYVTQYVSNDIGCMDSVQKPIVVDIVTTEISTLIPDAISPNNDGFNDVWELDFINLLFPDAKITILNQWGQLIFESVGYESPWDGKFNGEDVADGNYYYVIELNDSKEQVFKGVLLVLKTR